MKYGEAGMLRRVCGLFWGCLIGICLWSGPLWAFEVNEDGQRLIEEARQAFNKDLTNRPWVQSGPLVQYVDKVAKRIVPKDKALPQGVQLRVCLIDALKPELYSYVDGHLVLTSGLLFAMDNEAQLAGVLAHEVACIVEGYHLQLYQQIKAAERRMRYRAAAGALLGNLLDIGVDYALEMESIRATDRMMAGEATYRDTMEKIAAMSAAEAAYYSIKDVVASIPKKAPDGQPLDPRLQFEPIADAHGMVYAAQAGYDVGEAASGWDTLWALHSQQVREKESALGPWAGQIREMEQLMARRHQRMMQTMGTLGLVQTDSQVSPDRAGYVSSLTKLQEVRAAIGNGQGDKGRQAYLDAVQTEIGRNAQEAMDESNYAKAQTYYELLDRKGVRNAKVSYGLAKSTLGEFAFGASEGQKKRAEKYYLEAIGMNKKYALAYKGLGELYEDWERYDEAAGAYGKYLQYAPKASDRKRITRRIKVMKRKASR